MIWLPRCSYSRPKGSTAMPRFLLVAFSALVFLASSFAQNDHAATGTIRGEVVTRNQNGEPAVLPSARIVLHGSVTKETESDKQGAFVVDGLPPGIYQIEANAPGLNAVLATEVIAGTSSTVSVEMSVAAVTNTVSVTATEASVPEESAQQNTISQSVVETAPNQEE